jgi:RsiW-degrading membrane proteinase PrsW (M82 family)
VELIFPLLLSFFLPFLWVFYLYKKDKHPESPSWLFLAFLLGILSAFLSLHTEKFFYNLYFKEKDQIYYFIITAFIEEFFKFLLIRIFIFPQKVFDEAVDAMIYMSFSALGFAFIENVGVVLDIYQEPSEFKVGFYEALFIRFLGANLLHVLASSLIGFGYAVTSQRRHSLALTIFFFVATSLHFLYNLIMLTITLNKINIESGILLVLSILWFFFFVVLYEINYLNIYNGRTKREA